MLSAFFRNLPPLRCGGDGGRECSKREKDISSGLGRAREIDGVLGTLIIVEKDGGLGKNQTDPTLTTLEFRSPESESRMEQSKSVILILNSDFCILDS